jgi:hypothetical protein
MSLHKLHTMRHHRIPLVLLTCLSVFSWTACGVRRGDVVILPESFEGWVVIFYEVPGKLVLPREGFKNLINVPPSGIVLTKSVKSIGYGIDEYYLGGPNGSRKRIWTEFEGCKASETCVREIQFLFSPVRASLFFVGGEADIARFPRPDMQSLRSLAGGAR